MSLADDRECRGPDHFYAGLEFGEMRSDVASLKERVNQHDTTLRGMDDKLDRLLVLAAKSEGGDATRLALGNVTLAIVAGIGGLVSACIALWQFVKAH